MLILIINHPNKIALEIKMKFIKLLHKISTCSKYWTSTTNNSLFLTMLERYIVKPMKRWHLKLNYIAPSPKRTTPALKHFHSMERDKELATQEQNGHFYQCSHDKSSWRIKRRMYNKLTLRQSNMYHPHPRIRRRQTSLRE